MTGIYRKEMYSLPNQTFHFLNSSLIKISKIKALLCASSGCRGPSGLHAAGCDDSFPHNTGCASVTLHTAGRDAPSAHGTGPVSSCLHTASLTVEAAVTLPVFLICMLAVLHFLNVYNCAARLSAAIAQTSEEMAVGAYASEYYDAGSLPAVVLSSAYATGRVYAAAGDTSPIRNGVFLLSGFLEEDDMIDLVMTWQVASPVGMVTIPGTIFIQRGAVRGWTGREGSEGSEAHSNSDDHDHTTVYVAENGVVYHRDPNCTHIRLTIMPVSKDEAKNLRNVYREKYHPCEICGRKASGTVYITTDGNRYHSSLECSGLKRTIHETTLDQAGNLRPCSKCGGIHSG